MPAGVVVDVVEGWGAGPPLRRFLMLAAACSIGSSVLVVEFLGAIMLDFSWLLAGRVMFS
ncbi:MAG: hypothetical protein QM811_16675 [Pirellulales bacterium]